MPLGLAFHKLVPAGEKVGGRVRTPTRQFALGYPHTISTQWCGQAVGDVETCQSIGMQMQIETQWGENTSLCFKMVMCTQTMVRMCSSGRTWICLPAWYYPVTSGSVLCWSVFELSPNINHKIEMTS